MKRNYIILLAALLTVACAGNGDTMSPTPQEGEILFSGSTVGPKVRTSYEDTETALRVNWVKNDLIGLFAESRAARTWEPISATRRLCRSDERFYSCFPAQCDSLG